MNVRCEAVVKNSDQRENLCTCAIILGGDPDVIGDSVLVEYDGDRGEAMVELFEQYTNHTIQINAD